MSNFDTLIPVIALVIGPILLAAWIKRRKVVTARLRDQTHDKPGDWSN